MDLIICRICKMSLFSEMSLSDLISFPLIPKSQFSRFRTSNSTNVRDLNTLYRGIDKLIGLSRSGDKLAQTIITDLYLSIHHESIYKENITGKRIEDKFSELFALSTGDEMRRENPLISALMLEEDQALFETEVLNLVSSNYREKGDLFFVNTRINSLYKVSIKSLVPTNKEINFGAFEFLSTIKGIPELSQLLTIQERKRTIQVTTPSGELLGNIGLGSASQLRAVWNFINSTGTMEQYLNRFRLLLTAVYKDDFIIYIKDPNNFKVYLLENDKFIAIVLEKIAMGFVNMRVEGNAIRITDLERFKRESRFKFEYSFDSILPDKLEIFSILNSLQEEKADRLRRFCG